MVTCIRDLLNQVDQLAARDATESSADAAVAALGPLARALSVLGEHRFAAPGVYTAESNRRQLCVRELAAAAGWAAHCGTPTSTPQTPPARPTLVVSPASSAPAGPAASRRVIECAAVAADLIARRAPDTDAEARWAAAAALAETTRHVAAHARRFPPYARAPELARVTRLTILVAQLTDLDPPAGAAAAWLDRPVHDPIDRPVDRASGTGAVEVDEAVARLVETLAAEQRAGTLTVVAALAAAAAAETAAAHATRLADTITEQLRPEAPPVAPPEASQPGDAPWRACPDAWRVVQAGLVRFDDGARLSSGPASRTVEHAVALQRAVIAVEQAPSDRGANGHPVDLDVAANSTRYLANQLPETAHVIGSAVRQWAIEGKLMARARNLPRTEQRITELLRDQVVIVTLADVDAMLLATRVATRLAAALAVELDRTATVLGHQPQPGLLAALTRLQPGRSTERDADWAHTVALHPNMHPAASVHTLLPVPERGAGAGITFSG